VADVRPPKRILSDSECLSPACDRLRSDVNDLTHHFDVDSPVPDRVREHTAEPEQFLRLMPLAYH